MSAWAGVLLRMTAYVVAWLVLSAAAGAALFLTSERTVDVASHSATLRPDLSGQVLVRTGPVFPDLRTDSGSRIGVEVQLGKTDAPSVQELGQRYAAIATNPDGQIVAVRRAVVEMALEAAVRGLALGAIPVLVWIAIGRDRRREIWRSVPTRAGVAGAAAVMLVGVGVTQPWRETTPEEAGRAETWQPLAAFLGPEVALPAELDDIEASGGTAARQTRRLVESAVSTYQQGLAFYRTAAADAGLLELREPEEGETVVLLVSDRHDNVGMDLVARAIGDRGGATAILNAGDDTSTGESWEAFSLDSLHAVFEDWEHRWAVAGNHDHGDFVRQYLEDLGWTYFDGEVIDGPGDSRILGVDDPRASGLGSWRDESGLTFEEVRQRLAEETCAAAEAGDRVNTLLVHDANLGRDALAAGCVDLVVGGHTHVEEGPTAVLGSNGETGYTFTVGTTGGAAYAIATGSKPRRTAGVALITYRDGRPVGIQSVSLKTNGAYETGEYVELTY